MDIFLTDIIGYDRLKLCLKIDASQNEILGTPLPLIHLLHNIVYPGLSLSLSGKTAEVHTVSEWLPV